MRSVPSSYLPALHMLKPLLQSLQIHNALTPHLSPDLGGLQLLLPCFFILSSLKLYPCAGIAALVSPEPENTLIPQFQLLRCSCQLQVIVIPVMLVAGTASVAPCKAFPLSQNVVSPHLTYSTTFPHVQGPVAQTLQITAAVSLASPWPWILHSFPFPEKAQPPESFPSIWIPSLGAHFL